MTHKLLTILTKLEACEEAIDWVRNYPDPQTAWDACPRGDWMVWYLARSVPPLNPHEAVTRIIGSFCIRAVNPARDHVLVCAASSAQARAALTLARARAEEDPAAAAAQMINFLADEVYQLGWWCAWGDAAEAELLARVADCVRTEFPAAPTLRGATSELPNEKQEE